MNSRKTRSLAALGAIAGVLAFAGSASAASVTYTVDGDEATLDVLGTNDAEAFKLSAGSDTVTVDASSGVNDPDGPSGTACTTAGTAVTCAANAITVEGQANSDQFQVADGVSDLAATTLSGGAGADTFTGLDDQIEAHGDDDNDTFTASATGTLRRPDGGPGDDVFNGGTGSDVFVSEAGNDTYNGGSLPEPASKPADFDAANYQIRSAGDSIDYSGPNAVTVSLDGVANDGAAGETDNVKTDIEVVAGSSAADKLTAGALPVTLEGGAGADTLTGSPKDDSLFGEDGDDALKGGSGDDYLDDGDFDPAREGVVVPAAGNDTLDGGAGADALIVGRGNDIVTGGDGEDAVSSDRTATLPASAPANAIPGPLGVKISLDDVANDGAGAETDNISSTVEDVFTGGGDDTIVGSAAANVLGGGAGKDTITGGAGSDIISGEEGDDTINAQDLTVDRVDCGSGTDAATVDSSAAQPSRADVVLDCETLTPVELAPVFPLPAATATPVPPDTTPPAVTLSGSTTVKSKTFLKSGAITVGVSTTETATITGTVLYAGGKIASAGDLEVGSGKLAAGTGARMLKVTVAKSFRKAFKKKLKTKKQKKKGVALTLRVVAVDTAGLQTVSTRSVRVKG